MRISAEVIWIWTLFKATFPSLHPSPAWSKKSRLWRGYYQIGKKIKEGGEILLLLPTINQAGRGLHTTAHVVGKTYAMTFKLGSVVEAGIADLNTLISYIVFNKTH